MLYMHTTTAWWVVASTLGSGSDADDVVVLLFVKTHT